MANTEYTKTVPVRATFSPQKEVMSTKRECWVKQYLLPKDIHGMDKKKPKEALKYVTLHEKSNSRCYVKDLDFDLDYSGYLGGLL